MKDDQQQRITIDVGRQQYLRLKLASLQTGESMSSIVRALVTAPAIGEYVAELAEFGIEPRPEGWKNTADEAELAAIDERRTRAIESFDELFRKLAGELEAS